MSYPISIKVAKLIITETGTYNDQFRRPYQSQLTASGLHEIVENASRSPKITPSIFSGLTSQVLAPSASAESVIQIPEGWSERRFKFLLDLEVTYKTGGILHEIVTGYSETPASTISLYNTLDPNTTFRVNNTIHIRSQTIQTPYGPQSTSALSDCSHVLSNNDWSGIRGNSQNFLLRPTDIFSRVISSEVEAQLEVEGSYDASAVLMNNATKSRRVNNIPTNYLSDIVRNYSNAYQQFGIGMDEIGRNDAFGTAQQYSRENSASRDPFLETLANINGVQVQNTFTLNDLARIDPDVSNRTIYMKKGAAQIAQLHQSGQTSGWQGSDLHTHIANLLSNAVPSIMISNLIMKVAFISSNMDITGRLDTRIVDIDGFAQGVDMSPYARAFVSKFENEVLSDIVNNFQVSIGVSMQVDLIGETWIELTVNGEKIDYVVPSFSDALFTPIITSNQMVGRQLSSDLKNLMENVVDYNSTYVHPQGSYNPKVVQNPGDNQPPKLTYTSFI